MLDVLKSLSEPCSNALMGAAPSDGTFAAAVVLPYTLSSQSSTIIFLVMLGRRASSRMVYLLSRAGSVYNDAQPASVVSVSSSLKLLVSIMYFYNRIRMVVR